jgi:tRNA G18 (ribose-2'-O)-methylase SpoU
MKKLTFKEISARRLTKQELHESERFPIFTLLDNIRSLHNVGSIFRTADAIRLLGSIFRTADAIRLQKLYLTGITGHPPRKEIDKTALGAVETVIWEYQNNPLEVIKSLKAQKVKIIVLEHTTHSIPYNEVSLTFPVCLVVGNEVFGVQDKIVELSDIAVEIPMYGAKQSLNVTIAYGVVIYDILFKYFESTRR